MKKIILIFCVMFYVNALFAQKKLSQLTIDNKEMEAIDSSTISSIANSQKQKGENFKRFYDIALPKNTENNKVFKFKETGEVVRITNLFDSRYKENWNKAVATLIETFASEDGGRKRYVEHLNGKTYQAVIFFTKEDKHGVLNHIMYKNPEKEAFLFINYMSDLPDEAKIKNMRKIVKELQIR